jgi:hypothetical protein
MGLVKKNLLKVLGVAFFLVAVGFLAGLLLGIIIGGASLAGQGTALQIISALAGSAVNSFLGVLVQ